MGLASRLGLVEHRRKLGADSGERHSSLASYFGQGGPAREMHSQGSLAWGEPEQPLKGCQARLRGLVKVNQDHDRSAVGVVIATRRHGIDREGPLAATRSEDPGALVMSEPGFPFSEQAFQAGAHAIGRRLPVGTNVRLEE
jgi:hypothetical protein